MWRVAPILSILIASAGTAARADDAGGKGRLRVTATWGDARFVGGFTQTALSRDGRRLAASVQGGVIVWDVTGGAEVHIPMATPRWSSMQLAFGAGDRVLLTAHEHALTAWDATSGRKLGGVTPAGFERANVALAPGSSLAAIWDPEPSSKYHLEIWDVEKGTRVQDVAGEPLAGYAGTVNFAGDGRRLFVRRATGTNRSDRSAEQQGLWNVADGKLIYKDSTTGGCYEGTCTPLIATLLADGRTLVRTFDRPATGGAPSKGKDKDKDKPPAQAAASEPWLPQRWIEIVDLDGDRATVLERSPFEIQFSLSGDERTLATTTAKPDQIAIWDLGRRVRKTLKIAEHGVARLKLSTHGTLLMIGGNIGNDDSWLAVYRTSDGRRLSELPHVARRNGSDGYFDLDDTAGLLLCLTGCPPPTDRIVAWDVNSGKPAFDLPGAGNRTWFSTKRGPLIQMAYAGFDLRAAAAPWPSLLPAPRHTSPVSHLGVSRDGKWLAEASDEGVVLLRSLADPKKVVALPDQGPPADVAFLSDKDLLAVVYPGRAALWDPAKREVVSEVKAQTAYALGRLLAGGHRVAFSVERRAYEVRSLDDGRVVETLERPCGVQMTGLRAIDFAGGLCARSDDDASGALRALWTGAVRARLGKKHRSNLRLAVSKDGTRALVSRDDGEVQLVSLGGGSRVRALAGTTAETSALAFTPDGRRAVTGSVDGVLRLWDAATGALLDSVSFADRLDRPTAIDFAPDSRTLFVGTARGLVHKIELAAP